MATTAEYGLGDFTFPRGWFMIAGGAEIDKKPQAIRFFGQDMVIYRGESGRVVVIDAYCPHMGTHFAKNETSYVVLDGNQVEGDSIRCPYHGWRFTPDGQCDDISYSPAPIPKAACVKSWPIKEEAGCVFIWHDPEGGKPDYDVPAFPEFEDKAWVNPVVDHLGIINCHAQEIVDNIADRAHLEPIHGSNNMEYFESKFEDHIVRQDLAAGHRTLSDDTLYNDSWYTGPGILISKMDGQMPSIMLICHTPVEDGTVMAWHMLFVKSTHAEATEEDVSIARQYQAASLHALMQDYEVWENKRPCLQIMQVVGDGPFGKVRTWYKQFYNPRAQAKSFQEKVNGTVVAQGTLKHPWPTAAE